MGTTVSLGPLSLGQALALRSSPGSLEGVVPGAWFLFGGEVVWIWCVDGSCGRDGHVHRATPHVRLWSEGQWRESTFCAGPSAPPPAGGFDPLAALDRHGARVVSIASSCTPARNRLSPTVRRKGEAGWVWKGLWSQLYRDLRPLLALWPGAGCLSNWTLTASFDRACNTANWLVSEEGKRCIYSTWAAQGRCSVSGSCHLGVISQESSPVH